MRRFPPPINLMTSLKNYKKHTIGIAVSIIFVAFVEYYVGWTKLLSPWQNQSWGTILSVIVLLLISYLLRALRLYDYFKQEMRGHFLLTCRLMLQHNFFNNMLPMRTGEASFPILIRRYFCIPMSHSIPALLWFRMLDAHTLLMFAAMALMIIWQDTWPTSLCLVLLATWLTVPYLVYVHKQRFFSYLYSYFPKHRQPLLDKIQLGLPQTKVAFWRAWLWTVANWSIKISSFAYILTLFGPIPGLPAVLGAITGDASSILPWHGVAGAGTFEAGVLVGLLPFDIDSQTGLSVAINLHIIILGTTIIGGILSVLIPTKLPHG